MNSKIKNLKQKLKSKIRKLRRLRHVRPLTRGKIALILAGGGAKSLSQIGVLRVLEKET